MRGGGALWTVHFLLDAILILPEAGNEKLKNKSFFYVVITREMAKKNNLKEYVSKKRTFI